MLVQRPYRVAVLALVVAWLALTSPWLAGGWTIPYDARAHFQAQLQFLANALHDGESPFWTPNVFAGSPQIADPQSMLFSPALLLALFDRDPSFWAVDAMMFGYLLVGAAALLMLFRDRGWHPAGGIVAALGFAFGASASSRIQHFGQIHSLAFFALTLWLLDRALRRSSLRWGVAAGVSGALMVVEPDQVAMLSGYALALFVLDHWLAASDGKAAFARSLRPLVAGATVGLAICAVPVLMTWLFVESSNRPAIDLAEALSASAHPASLLTAGIADLFGAVDSRVDYWGPGSAYWHGAPLFLSQNMGQLYVGALPLVAILLFGLDRGRIFAREARWILVCLVIFTFYALGSHTPAFEWAFRTVPGVDMFRRPADATFLMGVFASLLGGYVVHRLATDPTRLARAGAMCRLWLPRWPLLLGGAFVLAFPLLGLAVALGTGKLDVAAKPLLTATAWLSGAALLLLLVRGRWLRLAPGGAVLAAALFGVLDLGLNQGPNESTALSPSLYDALLPSSRNETIGLIKSNLRAHAAPDRRDRVELVGLGFQWPNTSLVHGFDHTLGYNPLRNAEFAEATGAGDTVARPEDRRFTPLFPSYRSLLADMLGLRLIVCRVPIEKVDPKLKPGDLRPLGVTRDGYAYENPRALPRAMFVTGWRQADFEELIRTGEWPEFDPRRTVLLESEPDLPQGAAMSAPASGPANAQVSIERYQNGRVEVRVAAEQAGFLVLNDSFHPWWFAEVDGQPADILRANVLFRAVQVPAGAHKIVFEFRPLAGAAAELGERIFPEAEEPDAAVAEPPPKPGPRSLPLPMTEASLYPWFDRRGGR